MTNATRNVDAPLAEDEWQIMSLGEAGVVLIDCDHRTPPAATSGYPYVAIPQLRAGRIDFSTARRITPEDFAEWTKKARPMPNDIVLSRRCNPGETAFVHLDAEFAVGQNLVLLRADGRRVHPPFLRWLVRSPNWWEQVGRFINVGAVFDSLRCADIPRFELPIPPRDEQEAIAHILGALDDKIELNRRMNDTLEAVAQRVFKSWRASFDVIRVKVSDFVRDGVLEIGDGYRAKNSELREPGLPFIRARDLNDGFDTTAADALHEDSVRKAGTKVSRVGDVAFTSKGTIGRFARVTEYTVKFAYSPQVCFWRSLDRGKLEPAVLYLWMQSDELRAQIEAVAGQTDMAPYVSLRDQRQMEMPLFPQSQHGIAEQLDSFLARQALFAEEIKALAALRDALLPKLVSGELRVSDAERLVESAVETHRP